MVSIQNAAFCLMRHFSYRVRNSTVEPEIVPSSGYRKRELRRWFAGDTFVIGLNPSKRMPGCNICFILVTSSTEKLTFSPPIESVFLEGVFKKNRNVSINDRALPLISWKKRFAELFALIVIGAYHLVGSLGHNNVVRVSQ